MEMQPRTRSERSALKKIFKSHGTTAALGSIDSDKETNERAAYEQWRDPLAIFSIASEEVGKVSARSIIGRSTM